MPALTPITCPGHLQLLEELLRLFGIETHAHRRMFSRRGHSRFNKIAQALYAPIFMAEAILWRGEKVVLYGEDFPHLRGEIVVSDTHVCATAARLGIRGAPFIVAPKCKTSPVQKIIAALGLDPDVTAFLSINSLLILFATRRQNPVALHLGTSAPARRAALKHKEGLEIANAVRAPARIRALIPRLLAVDEIDGTTVLLQTRLSGKRLNFHALDPEQLWFVLSRAMDTIRSLHEAPIYAEFGPDHHLIFHAIPAAFEKFPYLRDTLGPVLEEIHAWHAALKREGVLVHGDYWVGNVLFDSQTLDVSGIIDWECAREAGMPGLDAIHFALMSAAMERRLPISDFILQVLTGAWKDPTLERYVAEIRQSFNLSVDYVEHIGALIYLSLVEKLATQSNACPIAERPDLLVKPVPALLAWAEKKRQTVNAFNNERRSAAMS